MGRCFYCNKEKPSSELRKCSKCLLTVYCSRACQRASWSDGHKKSCSPHPALVIDPETNNPIPSQKPDIFSDEWVELEVDRQLSKWLGYWRSAFCSFATIALDLANYDIHRLQTHCLLLIVQPNNFVEDKFRQYSVIAATVETISSIEERCPEIKPIIVDLTDNTKFRFIVILQNHKGEDRRLRRIQWNNPDAAKYFKIQKEDSKELAKGVPDMIIAAVETMTPAMVEKKLGQR